MKYNKKILMISKVKEFLEFGLIYNANKISSKKKYIYFFFEDILKKNNINFLKFFSKEYSYNFMKIKKKYLIFFSIFFKKFKGGNIYCNFFNDNFFFNYINFLKININFLIFFEIKPLIFILDKKIYSVSYFLKKKINKNPYKDLYVYININLINLYKNIKSIKLI